MGRNKQVSCKICFKTMRSDVVKRHMKVHEKRNKQICGELLNEIVDKVFVQKESAKKEKVKKMLSKKINLQQKNVMFRW